jgi:SRSO17 transposase
MDAGYGCNTDLRTSVSALELTYVAGIFSHTTVWTCDTRPLPPKKWSGRSRPTKRLRRDRKHQPIAVKELALNLPKRAWRTIKSGLPPSRDDRGRLKPSIVKFILRAGHRADAASLSAHTQPP